MKFAQGCILYIFLSQTQRKGISTYVCRHAGALPSPLQAKKTHNHKLQLLDLSLSYSRSTKTTQCLGHLSVAMLLSVEKLHFISI